MRIAKYFSPFYDFARRQLDVSPKVVDALISKGATATLAGHVVTISADGHAAVTAHVGIGHTHHAANWVNEFNSKAITA